jgi:hypothetical protein
MSGAIPLLPQYAFLAWAGPSLSFYSIQLVLKQYEYGLSHVVLGLCFVGAQGNFIGVLF